MITKSPENRTAHQKNALYTNAARSGFHHLLKSLDLKQNERILLPAYIGVTDREGSGVFDPVRANHLGFDFYAVDKQLNADIEDLEKKIRAGGYKVLLVIHYFGFAQIDLDHIVELCRANNIILIEDCAHALYSKHNNIPLGDFGDFSFFSVHKYLPSTDGGILKINSRAAKAVSIPEHLRMSRETFSLLFTSDEKAIADIRVANYEYLQQGIRSIDKIEVLFPHVGEGIIPMNLPVLVNGLSREKLYFQLMEMNIPTIALYYRLIPEISKAQHPVSYEVSENILNLPVHQDIEESDLDYMIESLAALL